MTGLWETALAFLLIALAVLAFQLIFLVLQVKDTAKRLKRTLEVVNKDLPEVMEHVTVITRTMASSSTKLETTVKDIAEIERIVSDEIKDPIKHIAQTVSTVLQLVNRVFFRKKKQKNGA